MFERLLAAMLMALLGIGAVYAHTDQHNPVRAHYLDENGVPEPYQGLENPMEGTQKNLAAGQELYLKSCANCHGQNGQADTPLAENLEPAPPTLTVLSKRMDGEMMGDGQMMEMGSVEDGYLFWVLEKGGQPTGSAMPATENSLSDTERWQIIHYLRSGLTTDG